MTLKIFREQANYLKEVKNISYSEQATRLGIPRVNYTAYRLRATSIPDNIIKSFDKEFKDDLKDFVTKSVSDDEEIMLRLLGKKALDIDKLTDFTARLFRKIAAEGDEGGENIRDLIEEYNGLMRKMGKTGLVIPQDEE